jgi:hypothetical protein
MWGAEPIDRSAKFSLEPIDPSDRLGRLTTGAIVIDTNIRLEGMMSEPHAAVAARFRR